MADKFLEYMGKPLVRSGDEIYYGDMNDNHIVKESTKNSMFEALDVGFVWLDRALK